MHQYPRPLAQIHADELVNLPPAELAKLRYEWDLWRLPHQEPPDWERFGTWLQVGGRGSGKNTGVCQWLRDEICNNGVRRINLIGRTAAAVRDDMVCGEAGIIAAFPPHQRPEYISSQSMVRFHTGATALMLSGEEPESIQGKNAEAAWCDEFSTYARPEDVWTQVVLSTRVGPRPKKAITTNWMPPSPFLERLVDEAEERRIWVVEASSFDNFANLPEEVQLQVHEMMRTAFGRAWVTGKRLQIEGALWKQEWFRWQPSPPGGRIVIGVDPSGTELGDETGIVVAKRLGDRGYVLEDLSQPHSDRWAEVVVDAYIRHRANLVVIEVNRGIGFLRGCINPVAEKRKVAVAMKEVYSTKQKKDRALPVGHLYELNSTLPVLEPKIAHAQRFTKLEEMMTNWDPDSMERLAKQKKSRSPDRIDALVFALTELGFHLGLASKGLAPIRPLPRNRI